MAYDSDDRGSVHDSVIIELAGKQILVKQYDIQLSVLESPSAFSVTLGHGDGIRSLIEQTPPKTPFGLSINSNLQFTGESDGYEASSESGGTSLTIRGRDDLAPLQDAYVTADTSFTNASVVELVEAVLKAAGISGYSLVVTNEAVRKKQTGAPSRQTAPPGPAAALAAPGAALAATTVGGALVGAITGLGISAVSNLSTTQAAGGKKPEARKIQAKVGQRWFDFLRDELDRLGLFLWAGSDKTFVLSCPNANQGATYEIIRQRSQTRNLVNVISARLKNETTMRHSSAQCYCRGGGKELGRTTSRGLMTDDEMVAYGYSRPFAMKDEKGSSLKQAEYLARKCLAEGRRSGWQLSYTVSGHTTPLAKGGQRAVWAIDTVVHVVDDEFGIDADLYIASVSHRRGPETTTELTLMRKEDLIFGDAPL